MGNFMANYRGGDGHYADVECAYAELERYLVLSCKVVTHEGREVCRSPRSEGSLSAFRCRVTAIMLIESLILLILY